MSKSGLTALSQSICAEDDVESQSFKIKYGRYWIYHDLARFLDWIPVRTGWDFAERGSDKYNDWKITCKIIDEFHGGISLFILTFRAMVAT